MEHEDEVSSTRDDRNSINEIESRDDFDEALHYQLEYEEEIRRGSTRNEERYEQRSANKKS